MVEGRISIMVYKERRDLIKAAQEWLEEEHKAGKETSDQELADHFGISLREARDIHDGLTHGH